MKEPRLHLVSEQLPARITPLPTRARRHPLDRFADAIQEMGIDFEIQLAALEEAARVDAQVRQLLNQEGVTL